MPRKQEIAGFIRSTFRSVWSLEVLRFLHNHRERGWNPAEMIAALRASDLVVTQALASLTAAGLVTAEEDRSARYQPASADLDSLVEETLALYATSPDAVRRMIIASATGELTAFADAFRLRRD